VRGKADLCAPLNALPLSSPRPTKETGRSQRGDGRSPGRIRLLGWSLARSPRETKEAAHDDPGADAIASVQASALRGREDGGGDGRRWRCGAEEYLSRKSATCRRGVNATGRAQRPAKNCSFVKRARRLRHAVKRARRLGRPPRSAKRSSLCDAEACNVQRAKAFERVPQGLSRPGRHRFREQKRLCGDISRPAAGADAPRYMALPTSRGPEAGQERVRGSRVSLCGRPFDPDPRGLWPDPDAGPTLVSRGSGSGP